MWPHPAQCLTRVPRLGLAESGMEQGVCVCVFGEGDTDKAGLTSPSSAGRQWP